jgi:Cu/Ag efflux protein CusF
MNRPISLLLAAAFLAVGLALPAFADNHSQMPGAAAGKAVVVTATVEAIDLDSRDVTLKGENGESVVLTVSEEARNLGQVEVGDVVTFEYYQVLALALTPVEGVTRQKTESVEVERAELGEKPAGQVVRTVEAIGVVESIDKENRVVLLRGAEQTLELKVEDDVDLDAVSVGQNVAATYIEAFAVSVTPPKAL